MNNKIAMSKRKRISRFLNMASFINTVPGYRDNLEEENIEQNELLVSHLQPLA